ncbi:hypothetical protein J4210_00845 [Candidatus Woesearchaeota archaeon]|nr:hypothetical protein [Candidatus Woesearchaeota archaeon]
MTTYETPPAWFDPALVKLLEKKRDRSGIHPFKRLLDWAVRQPLKVIVPREVFNTHKHTWSDIERLVQEGIEMIKLGNYQPDVVVGIKSGGAFIANYVASCLGVGIVGYMKASHYSDKSGSIATTVFQMGEAAVIKESCTVEVLEKRVLLVDDQVATGASLQAAKQHLQDRGAGTVKTYCLFAKDPELVDYFNNPGLGIYFPWGKDA